MGRWCGIRRIEFQDEQVSRKPKKTITKRIRVKHKNKKSILVISKPTHRTQEFPSLSKPATATPQRGILFCRKREEGKIKSDIDVSRRSSSWEKCDARSDAIQNTSNVRQKKYFSSFLFRGINRGVERRLISQGFYFSLEKVDSISEVDFEPFSF